MAFVNGGRDTGSIGSLGKMAMRAVCARLGMEIKGRDRDDSILPCDRNERLVDGKVLKMIWPFDEKAMVG